MIYLYILLNLFGTLYRIDSVSLSKIVRPEIRIQSHYDTTKKIDTLRTSLSIQSDTIDDTTQYYYYLALRIYSKDNNGRIGLSAPAISFDGITWSKTVSYGLNGDTSATIATYEGILSSGKTVSQSRGGNTYAKSSIVSNGIVTEHFESYSTGMTVMLSAKTRKDKNIVVLSYNYSIPTNTETPPSTQTSSLQSEAIISSDTTIVFSGISYYAWKRSWWLFGLSRTLEELKMKIELRLKRLK